MNNLISPEDVSKILCINYRKVLELILRGQLKAYKIGRQYRLEESDVLEFLQKNTVR